MGIHPIDCVAQVLQVTGMLWLWGAPLYGQVSHGLYVGTKGLLSLHVRCEARVACRLRCRVPARMRLLCSSGHDVCRCPLCAASVLSWCFDIHKSDPLPQLQVQFGGGCCLCECACLYVWPRQQEQACVFHMSCFLGFCTQAGIAARMQGVTDLTVLCAWARGCWLCRRLQPQYRAVALCVG